ARIPAEEDSRYGAPAPPRCRRGGRAHMVGPPFYGAGRPASVSYALGSSRALLLADLTHPKRTASAVTSPAVPGSSLPSPQAAGRQRAHLFQHAGAQQVRTGEVRCRGPDRDAVGSAELCDLYRIGAV